MLQLLQTLSTPQLAISITGTALLSIVVYFVFQAFSSPTSHVPGPWHTRFTYIAFNYHWVVREDKVLWVDALHKKYGSIVRLTPTEVSLADLDSIKTVYTVREKFRKSDWYTRFVNKGSLPSIFNTSNIETHRRYRRVLAGPLAESSLKAVIPTVTSKIDISIQQMQREMKERGCTDIFKWWFFMASDVIGELTFGQPFGMLESGKETQFSKDVQFILRTIPWRTTYPNIAWFLGILGISPFKAFRDQILRVRAAALSAAKRLQEHFINSPHEISKGLFSKILQAHSKNEISFGELTVNSQTYIAAGSDTTSNTLTYLVWTLCKRPDMRDALVKELRTLPEDYDEKDLRQLPYLDNIINETLRCFSIISGALPRTVPPEGTELGGYHLRGGVTVSTQVYTLHRLPNIFPEPHIFDPNRWDNPTKAMKDAFSPFGRGPRVCIGLHLALIEIRIATAKFFLAFPNATASTREGMSEADMEPLHTFALQPEGGRCLVEL